MCQIIQKAWKIRMCPFNMFSRVFGLQWMKKCFVHLSFLWDRYIGLRVVITAQYKKENEKHTIIHIIWMLSPLTKIKDIKWMEWLSEVRRILSSQLHIFKVFGRVAIFSVDWQVWFIHLLILSDNVNGSRETYISSYINQKQTKIHYRMLHGYNRERWAASVWIREQIASLVRSFYRHHSKWTELAIMW